MLVLLAAATDTVALGTLARAPAFDGVVGAAEYGAPIASMPTSGGPVSVWMGRSGEWVYVAAVLPDSTPAWRDEFALLLDPIGDRTPGPGHDDSEWVIRRVVDSSEVLRGVHGSWQLPGNDPAWRLSAASCAARIRSRPPTAANNAELSASPSGRDSPSASSPRATWC